MGIPTLQNKPLVLSRTVVEKYTSGQGITVDNDDHTITARPGKGLSFDTDGTIQVNVGNGLHISDNNLNVELDNPTSDLLDAVNEMYEELDKKVTTTFPFAGITSQADFAGYGVTNTTRVIAQLFNVPIASEIRKNETLICITAKQDWDGKAMFGIFEFDYSGNNGTGSTSWLCDTGKVEIKQGENRYLITNVINTTPTRTKIKFLPDRLYYAALVIGGDASSTGLYLASCPGYDMTYNNTPRISTLTSNITSINWNKATMQNITLDYNEWPQIPRLFMMIRNKTVQTPTSNEPFDNIETYTLKNTSKVSDEFGTGLTVSNGVIYQKVIPYKNVSLTKLEYIDNAATPTTIASGSIPVIIDNSEYPQTLVNMSQCSVENISISSGLYRHILTLNTPFAMTANSIYLVPAALKLSNGVNETIVQYSSPAFQKDMILVKNIGESISNDNYVFEHNISATYCKIYSADKSWTI